MFCHLPFQHIFQTDVKLFPHSRPRTEAINDQVLRIALYVEYSIRVALATVRITQYRYVVGFDHKSCLVPILRPG